MFLLFISLLSVFHVFCYDKPRACQQAGICSIESNIDKGDGGHALTMEASVLGVVKLKVSCVTSIALKLHKEEINVYSMCIFSCGL